MYHATAELLSCVHLGPPLPPCPCSHVELHAVALSNGAFPRPYERERLSVVPVLPPLCSLRATSSSSEDASLSTPAPRSRHDPDRDDREHTPSATGQYLTRRSRRSEHLHAGARSPPPPGGTLWPSPGARTAACTRAPREPKPQSTPPPPRSIRDPDVELEGLARGRGHPPPHLACSTAVAALHASAHHGALTWPAPPRALPSRGWRCPPTSSP